ncbi:protein ELC-like [Ananas comosus]|uniref:Protein ELC-like n=2 Tax=Ananas comosus TaxID=4615 RepID=A0A6P5H7S4_ANACO|nr:protein ELC-like [Ananas comosus]XP_020113366.1 protein ELC-like [Ananas comosus]
MAPPPSPPIPASPGAQFAQQFLSTALSQRGPSALPYAEDVKWLIRNHLVALADAFPSLHPKSALFTHNDGRAATLLQAEGTVPIVYSGVVYNIPAVIWLPEPYPRSPPLVFLSPTRDMVIKPHHPHVDRSGLVHVPYLRSWVFPSSNLVDLVRSLSHLFGLDPPLYTRQSPSSHSNPSPSPNPNPNPNPNASPSPSASSRIYPSSSPYGSGGRFPHSPAPSRPPAEDPAEVFRRNAISKIVDRAHADMAGMRRTREAEMEGLFSTQAELRRRAGELSRGLGEMGEEKEGLEQQLQLVLMNTDVMEGWVRDNEVGRRRRRDVDVDDAFELADALSRQMLDCTAADLAAEDTIYALDKAVQEGSIPFEGYIKSVRALAREQFFHRALAARVRAAQVQAQVTSMASRVPQYAS